MNIFMIGAEIEALFIGFMYMNQFKILFSCIMMVFPYYIFEHLKLIMKRQANASCVTNNVHLDTDISRIRSQILNMNTNRTSYPSRTRKRMTTAYKGHLALCIHYQSTRDNVNELWVRYHLLFYHYTEGGRMCINSVYKKELYSRLKQSRSKERKAKGVVTASLRFNAATFLIYHARGINLEFARKLMLSYGI